jgi:hypothetical protein
VNLDAAYAALMLPESTWVGLRVPKSQLSAQGAVTSSDRRLIATGIEKLTWAASLKPATTGYSVHVDGARVYGEIAVLLAELRAPAHHLRLCALIQRAVPYPMLLLAACGDVIWFSVAHKRQALNDSGKIVLDGPVISVDLQPGETHTILCLDALVLRREPGSTLRTVYDGWLDALIALHAARRTGRFELAGDPHMAQTRYTALMQCARLDAEIAAIRSRATSERQMAKQIALNQELKQAEAARDAALAALSPNP